MVSFFVIGCHPIALEGEVVDGNMRPLAAAKIVVKRSAQIPLQTNTDKAGRFSLTNLQVEDSILFVREGYKPVWEILHPSLIRYPRLTVVLENH